MFWKEKPLVFSCTLILRKLQEYWREFNNILISMLGRKYLQKSHWFASFIKVTNVNYLSYIRNCFLISDIYPSLLHTTCYWICDFKRNNLDDVHHLCNSTLIDWKARKFLLILTRLKKFDIRFSNLVITIIILTRINQMLDMMSMNTKKFEWIKKYLNPEYIVNVTFLWVKSLNYSGVVLDKESLINTYHFCIGIC